MTRYVAFLRGVSPMNASMPELIKAFEAAGFGDVKTVLASGNVNFSSKRKAPKSLQELAERAMEQHARRSFLTIVRELSKVERLLAEDPYAAFKLAKGSKRVVTFLREAPGAPPKLPISLANARILALQDGMALSAYVPNAADGPAFMRLIERTFGKDVSTRTWETLGKIVKAG
jgi:uncharacterized protein (DUF1697 family)